MPAILELARKLTRKAPTAHEASVEGLTCRVSTTFRNSRDKWNHLPPPGQELPRMDGLTRLVIIVTLSLLGENSLSDGAPLDPFPLGTIGCLVSDVCDKGEICTNDSLFGSCQSQFSRLINGENRFELETDQIGDLEEEIRRLIKAGFTWKDAYTQCTLQNTLVEFSRGRTFSRYLCEDALGVASPDWSDDVNDEISDVLLKLLDSGRFELSAPETTEDDVMRSGEPTGLDILNSNKRDEIVKVHKYFDKSKGVLKRDPLFFGSGSSYNMLYPNERLNPGSLYYSQDMFQDDNGGGYRTGYPQNDEALEAGESSPFDMDTLSRIQQNKNFGQYLSDMSFAAQAAPETGVESYMGAQTTEPVSSEYDQSMADLVNNLILSKEDQDALAGVAEGEINSEDLEPAQRARLRVFIQTLLQLIMAEEGAVDPYGMQGTTPADIEEDMNTGASPDPFNEMEGEEVLPPLSDLGEPELEEDGAGDAGNVYELDGQDGELDEVEDESRVRDSILRQALLSGEVPMDKKMSDEAEDEDDSVPAVPGVEDEIASGALDEPFDRNTMYLELSRYLDEPDAIRFVNNITQILHLPLNMIQYRLPFPHHYIMLRVEDDPNGKWDGLKIGNAAMEHNDDLLKATNTTILKAGIGEPVGVLRAYYERPDSYPTEAKQNNRYVVLTFILVGTIAGVVLAVVITYLCKRHHRSKQKLAQLASNPDGNEASKDYQDLCRQRMQGKSSEKPEPLHAASRIGSVSENQVRSPSSRSSTSSWSEEPAATNMDISTGHIVLSYMEDHLRNQDRLDQEWEAVSSYVADPSSTKVASDACNMRKNRFTDILPYDHSRVILSSSANVSNSDFINASFITDHDPRNPAYICTQGPLPHTVADFWQMIWEQGSVVIVMLTKLTENGTSLCHRYWPEEGSDLYHIYEVHLVSEHIWCDDYLVRSFYLKNLQTNETRTVTQFHFLTWPQLSVPASIKALLDFRRKVNKSFRGRSCPIVVHCSDGCGRSGTYCLIDMVLNKMAKGAKEIDMAATLEHIRDQRMSMVKTKEQFQFSLAAVAEEVHAILKALPQ